MRIRSVFLPTGEILFENSRFSTVDHAQHLFIVCLTCASTLNLENYFTLVHRGYPFSEINFWATFMAPTFSVLEHCWPIHTKSPDPAVSRMKQS